MFFFIIPLYRCVRKFFPTIQFIIKRNICIESTKKHYSYFVKEVKNRIIDEAKRPGDFPHLNLDRKTASLLLLSMAMQFACPYALKDMAKYYFLYGRYGEAMPELLLLRNDFFLEKAISVSPEARGSSKCAALDSYFSSSPSS